MKPDQFIETRQTLLERLRKWDDHESWQEFFDLYWRLIHRTAIRTGLSEEEARDVVQDTILTASKSLPTFRYMPERCSFKSWLLKVTRWRIIDQFRKRARKDGGGKAFAASPEVLNQIRDPAGDTLDSLWEREWEANLIEAATEKTKQTVTPKQYQIFYLSALKQLAPGEVARRMGVNVAAVYLARHRVGRVLQRHLKLMRAKAQ